VLRGGAAERAGLSVGDEVLALQGWRLRRLDEAARLMVADTPATLLVARDQRVLSLSLVLPAAPTGAGVTLKLAAKPAAPAAALQKAWLSA
jgi:predicted metalloprotease with PDZ domain